MISTEHTSKQFDAELDMVRAQVLQMGGLVESQIRLTIEALVSDDVPLMSCVINDDHRVNAMEVQNSSKQTAINTGVIFCALNAIKPFHIHTWTK